MRRMTTIIMLIIAPVAIQAASFKVTGQVFRSDTKQPVSYASVLIKQGTNILQIFTTEDDGRFNFENLPSGKLLLIAKQAGFYSEDISLDMKGNRRVTVYLVPAGTMTMGEIEVLGEKQRGTVSKNIITKEMRQKATTSITGDSCI